MTALVAFGILLAVSVGGAQDAPPASTSWDAAEIARALDAVKADPNLATERTMKTLAWRTSERRSTPSYGWWRWVADFVRWMNQTTRWLLWGCVALLAGFLALALVRLLRARYDATAAVPSLSAITHVHDMDIRPESLPRDIGAAARQLWDRGDSRAALSLLYRGLLSRLVHVHRLPIRDSSTEGDCVALSAAHFHPDRQAYVVELISAWERSVYGHTVASTALVHALCGQFSAALDAPSEVHP